MPSFLSSDWFDTSNRRLGEIGPIEIERDVVVGFAITGATTTAMYLECSVTGARLVPEVHQDCDVEITLDGSDAERIFTGDAPSAELLREGRVKVRGDVSALNAIAPVLARLQTS